MTILDGSHSFFDTESLFSDLVSRARAAETEESLAREKLYRAFASFSGAKEENVIASGEKTGLALAFIGDAEKILVPSCDGFADMISGKLPDREFFTCQKNEDLKLRVSDLVSLAEGTGAEAIIMSNPCFPTSLAVEKEDIERLCESTSAVVIVDESRLVSSADSLMIDTCKYDNLAVIRQFNFGGYVCMGAGKIKSAAPSTPAVSDMMAASVIFEHSSAIKTYERKLSDSIGSLYIRLKKAAIKYDSIERIYRSRADFVYLSVYDAENKAGLFLEEGIKVGSDNEHIWIFAGDTKENDELITKSSCIF